MAQADTPIDPRAILIIDDDTAMLEALEVLCTSLLWPNIHCAKAATLKEGIILFQERDDVDLVISDLRLPDAEPDMTMRVLPTIIPPTVPLIVLTGSVWHLRGFEIMRGGADAFLYKGGDTFETSAAILQVWLSHCGRQVRAQATQVDVAPPLVGPDLHDHRTAPEYPSGGG